MKQLLLQIFMITLATITTVIAQPQQLDLYKMKSFEIQLDDVMELIDTNQLKTKLHQVQEHYKNDSNEINKVRLGIIYHETALNLAFFSKTKFKGYAKKALKCLMSYLSHLTLPKNYIHS